MKNTINKKMICTLGLCLLPTISHASIIQFDFTGRMIWGGDPIVADSPVAASMYYDTVSGLGGSSLSIVVENFFFGQALTFHDITMTRQGTSNLIDGNMLVDYSTSYNMPLHVEWDATGLFNAIDYGLQAGDVISGTNLYHDTNDSGLFDAGDTYLADVLSATPYSDSLQTLPANEQGPAPIAATINSAGFLAGPFNGNTIFFDIGSGNSLHVTSVSAVPVPAAVWLFGSGLLGLIGIARRKAT